MNQRQRKSRLYQLNKAKAAALERRRVKIRQQQEAFALAWHRDWIQKKWTARREARRIRQLDTPKSNLGDQW